MERVIFEVPGKPQGKGRPRASVVGGHARMYTPAGTASYENKIMLCYQQRHAGVRFVPPIILEVNAYISPRGWATLMLLSNADTRPLYRESFWILKK